MEKETIYLGMDVHKDTITLAAYAGSSQNHVFKKQLTMTMAQLESI